MSKKFDESLSSVIIGLGNTKRADDGIGIIAVERLRQLFPDALLYFDEEHDALDEVILSIIESSTVSRVIFIDSIEMGSNPGSVRILNGQTKFKQELSTHKTPIMLYIELLKNRDKDVSIIGIQYKTVEFGDHMSDEVLSAMNDIIILVKEGFNIQ